MVNMNRTIKNTIISGLAVIVIAGAAFLSVAEGRGDSKSTPPEFSTTNIVTNKDIKLSDYKGKVTLLNFWATWCPPCNEEIPAMNNLYSHYKGKVAIIAVSIDRASDEKVLEFTRSHGMEFDIAHDAVNLPKTYMVGSIPTTYVLDKNGNIVQKIVGMAEWDSKEAIEFFDKLVNE